MYEWRKMDAEQQAELLRVRQLRRFPRHGPPHRTSENGLYHLTAACFEHKSIIGLNTERMFNFSEHLLSTMETANVCIDAWCVLPNHYHLLIHGDDIKSIVQAIQRLHGGTSFHWNGEDDTRGRQVWSKASDRAIRSQRHYRTTVNYIHNNPVRHGYVKMWQEWPFSSAPEYLTAVGREQATAWWQEYALLDYGAGWDDL